MLKVSNRGQTMPASPIRKLTPYAEEAQKRGIKVYHLNIGQPDIETPKEALKAVRDNHLEVLSYSPSDGITSYKERLPKYYAKNGINLKSSEIMVTIGGSEAISFAFLSCLDPGDEIIIPEPFYANYNGFAHTSGITIKPVTSHLEDGFALPSLEKIEDLITSKTKAILICNPNNPTGYLYQQQELEDLKNICLKHNLYLFSDEAYREFCYEGTHFSALQLTDMEDYVVVMDTLSKRYSACGARLGALLTRNQEILKIALKFGQARLSPPTFAQIFGEAAIDTPDSYFQEVKTEYRARRDLLVSTLQNMEGVTCPSPGGAFYTMAELPVDDTEHFCQWLLEDFSYHQATVMVAPATGFYATPGLGKRQVRLAYVLQLGELQKALKCLEVALKTYPGRL